MKKLLILTLIMFAGLGSLSVEADLAQGASCTEADQCVSGTICGSDTGVDNTCQPCSASNYSPCSGSGSCTGTAQNDSGKTISYTGTCNNGCCQD
jgi:hypothetical protein